MKQQATPPLTVDVVPLAGAQPAGVPLAGPLA
jgi:hypothetical protein